MHKSDERVTNGIEKQGKKPYNVLVVIIYEEGESNEKEIINNYEAGSGSSDDVGWTGCKQLHK